MFTEYFCFAKWSVSYLSLIHTCPGFLIILSLTRYQGIVLSLVSRTKITKDKLTYSPIITLTDPMIFFSCKRRGFTCELSCASGSLGEKVPVLFLTRPWDQSPERTSLSENQHRFLSVNLKAFHMRTFLWKQNKKITMQLHTNKFWKTPVLTNLKLVQIFKPSSTAFLNWTQYTHDSTSKYYLTVRAGKKPYQVNFRIDIVWERGRVPERWTDPTILNFTGNESQSVDKQRLKRKWTWELWLSDLFCE